MAARSPSILSLEHSEKTCSCREAWGSLPSTSLTPDNAELNVPGALSEAGGGTDAQSHDHSHKTCVAKVSAAVVPKKPLTSDHDRREGVLAGHRGCLAGAGGVQRILGHQLLLLSIARAWQG